MRHEPVSNHISVVPGLADVVAYGGRGSGRGRKRRRLLCRFECIRGGPRIRGVSAAWRQGGQKGDRTDRAPQALHRLEECILIDKGGPIGRVTPRRDGRLVQQAVEDVPKSGKAQLEELKGFVARRGDGCVNF